MNILLTGAHGLVGAALAPVLRGSGHRVFRAARGSMAGVDEARWDVAAGIVEGGPSFGAVVHLAGASLAAGRWTPERKREIERSRVPATRGLCEWLARQPTPPGTLIAASAIGYYGDAGEGVLDETSPPGSGFLASVAARWEQACEPARQAGIRVVHVRFGLVLSRLGGALVPMLLPFRLGLGGPLGSGRQYWSWVALADVVGAIRWALDRPDLAGAVNVVAPEPVTQREFARVLGRVLHRPAVLPAPAWALRIALGEMADALVLSSSRVRPARLEAAGFEWRSPTLESALREALTGAQVDERGARA